MRSFCLTLCCLVAAAACCLVAVSVSPAKVKLVEDPAIIPQPQSGEVTGTIQPAKQVARISLVSRATKRTHGPKSFDSQTGRFAFTDLPGDAAYDVRVETTDGRKIEGIDLTWIEARMVRLAAMRRKQLHLPPERKHSFAMDDVDELLKWVEDWKDFMEIKRVLYVQGHGQRAVMLVELMRTREFHAAKGAVVWRVELWYMKNEYGGWDRLANAERVLHRERIQPDAWRRIDLQYYPELSVTIDPEGKSKPVHFTLPAKGDLSRGRLRNTQAVVKTKPHVRGLDVQPAKAPPHVILDK